MNSTVGIEDCEGINLKPLPSLPKDSYGIVLPRASSRGDISGSMAKRKYSLIATDFKKKKEGGKEEEEEKVEKGKVKPSAKKVKYVVKDTLGEGEE